MSLTKLDNLQTNVTVAAKYLRRYCATELEKKKIPVTAVNLYLAYQQGVGGFKALYKHIQNGTASTTPATSNELNNAGNLTYI